MQQFAHVCNDASAVWSHQKTLPQAFLNRLPHCAEQLCTTAQLQYGKIPTTLFKVLATHRFNSWFQESQEERQSGQSLNRKSVSIPERPWLARESLELGFLFLLLLQTVHFPVSPIFTASKPCSRMAIGRQTTLPGEYHIVSGAQTSMKALGLQSAVTCTLVEG